MNCTIHVAKTKALISFAVTAKLICAFVFASANCWFSHAAAHIKHDWQICILQGLVGKTSSIIILINFDKIYFILKLNK